MIISPHHVNNILRVYGDQLRQSMIASRAEDTDTNISEMINISAKTRSKTIINDMVSNIIERITQFGSHDHDEKEVSKKIESEPKRHVTTNKTPHNKLIFKEIDGNAEIINSFSIEDSKFSINKRVGKHEKK